MKTIKEITRKNFNKMFNLKEILEGSVFYPASGIDNSVIKCFSNQYSSFINVDYSISMTNVKNNMLGTLLIDGYDLICLTQIGMEEITPNGFIPNNWVLNEHERQRLEMDFISEKFYGRNFTPFALWGVYELNQNNMKETKRFSVLHIGGESCAIFEALYLNYKINPSVVALINPGEGYGDNWTLFTNPDFRLFKNLTTNFLHNNAAMPTKIITNMILNSNENDCFWPGYRFEEKCFFNDAIEIYSRI